MGAATVAIVLFNDNQERYVREALDGICGQTRPADQLIVIDDGSTDDSVAIIEEAAARHARMTFLRNGRNLGLQESMARALPLVTAEYLVWTSSDHCVLLPGFLEKAMPPLERHPEAGLCFSALSVVPRDRREAVRVEGTPWVGHTSDSGDLPEYMTPAAIRRRMKRAYLPIASNAVVLRREALDAIGGYPPELEWQSDSFVCIVIAHRFGACVVPDTLVLRRVDPGAYSDRGMADPARHAAMIASLLDLLAQPRYRDIRRAFRRSPGNFSPFRTPALNVQFHRVRDWDLFLPYVIWDSREYNREQPLRVAATVAELGLRWRRSIRAGLRRLLLALGRRVREALHSVRSVRRTMRLIAYALVKYRWQRYARSLNVVGTVRGPVTQDVVRSMVAWQLVMPLDGRLDIQGHLCIEGDTDQVQLDRLLSLLCVSGTFAGFDIFFDREVAVRELARIPATPEPRPESHWARFDLCKPHAVALGTEGTAGLQRAFLPLFDGRRTVTSFLKVAHPRAFVVALSLPEDDDGFADEALGKWLPHLHRFRQNVPRVAFCLLNRTMPSQDRDEPADVSPVRSLGFGLLDAVALAQAADAFIGRLDAFGLAAIGAHRPGVYIDPTSGERADAGRLVWFLADPSPEQCLELLRVVVRERLHNGRRSPTSPPVTNGPGTA